MNSNKNMPKTSAENKTPLVGYKNQTSAKKGLMTNDFSNENKTNASNMHQKSYKKPVTTEAKSSYEEGSTTNDASTDVHMRVEKPVMPVMSETTPLNKPKSIVSERSILSNGNDSLVKDVKNKTRILLDSKGDSGSSTLSTAISTADVSYNTFKTIRSVTPYVAKGAYRVAGRTYRVVRTIDRDVTTMLNVKGGTAMVGRRVLNELKKKKPVHCLVHAVGGVRTAVKTTGKYSIKTYRVVKGVLNGSVKVRINKDTLNRFKNKHVASLKRQIEKTSKHVVKTRVVVTKSINTLVSDNTKIVSRVRKMAISGASNMLANSDDTGLQSIGMGIKTAQLTVKGAKTTNKLIKTSFKRINTGLKRLVKTRRSYSINKKKAYYARKRGRRRFRNSIRNKSSKLIANSGKSVVSALIKVVVSAFQGSVLPIILIVLIVGGVFMMASGGLAGVLSAFAGVATNKDTGADVDEIPYLTNKINESRMKFVNDIKELRRSNLIENGGDYHYVRIFNSFDDSQMVLNDTNILNSILSTPQYLEYIQPVFHTILLSRYELEATEAEMEALYLEMWNALTDVTERELPLEYCTNFPHSCFSYHANTAMCPNYIGGMHSTYTCSTCCYYYFVCKGHKGNLNCGKTAHSHSSNCNTSKLICIKEAHEHTNCYSLIRTCNLNHEHNSTCYHNVFVCTNASSGHVHASPNACIASYLNCTKKHEHTASCFLNVNYCSSNHVHHKSCYNSYLNCTKNHEHTASCYKTVSDLSCGLQTHSHTTSCYTNSRTCGLEEHTHTNWILANNGGCYETKHHSGNLSVDCGNSKRHDACNGYNKCNGHKVLEIVIKAKGMGELLDSYFLDEITRLENKKNLTSDESDRLDELRGDYEICLAVMEVMAADLGTVDGSVIDLDDVTLTEITEFACTFIGKPYVWGGNDPNMGADCSGFVKYVFSHFGISLPRTSREQVTHGTLVNGTGNAVAGDLIFWSDDGTDGGVYHVAIYLGNGKVVHASNSKPYPAGGIKISSLYGTIYKVKRVVN